MGPTELDPAEMYLRKSLDGLRQKYIDALVERILDLEAALGSLREGGDRNAALGSIRQLAHRQVGLAPSLGFAEIGLLSRHVEILIDGGLTGPDNEIEDHSICRGVERLLDEMEAQLETPPRNNASGIFPRD